MNINKNNTQENTGKPNTTTQLKNHLPGSSRRHPRDTGMVQHRKCVNVTYDIDKLKEKITTWSSHCLWKAFHKIKHPFMKGFGDNRDKRDRPKIKKAIGNKLTDNIKLNGEKLSAISLKPRIIQDFHTLYLLNIVQELVISAINQ